jgi:hypothetical protein
MSDEPATDADDRPWRPAASGASFVYVFPRPGEDLLKLGMSRDPLERLQSLHPRWYEFFDLDAGWIAATDRVREARDIELRLARRLAAHNAPAPLTATRTAGGATEWYRGAGPALEEEANLLLSDGYPVHRPLRAWLGPRLRANAPLLFHWSEALLLQLESVPGHPCGHLSPLEWTLCNGLDALPALGIGLDGFVSARVLEWHALAHRRLGA